MGWQNFNFLFFFLVVVTNGQSSTVVGVVTTRDGALKPPKRTWCLLSFLDSLEPGYC